jgi:hypothetical protein
LSLLVLVDSSVLTRTLHPHHALYAITRSAIERLLEQGRELHIVPRTQSNYGCGEGNAFGVPPVSLAWLKIDKKSGEKSESGITAPFQISPSCLQ